MSSAQTQAATATGKSNVMVIFGDGRSAYHLIQAMGNANDASQVIQKFIAVCDKSVLKHMGDLKSRTVQVEGIDFNEMKDNNLKELDHLISENNVDWLVLIPFGDTFQPTLGFTQALQAFKFRRGKNVIMLSTLAADSNLSPSKQLLEAGKILREQFPQTNCILRTHVHLQDLDYFSDELKRKKTWRLHSGEGAFAPVCLRDDVSACIIAIAKESEMSRDFQNQIFKLTNSENVTGQVLAEMTKTAFRGDDVQFEDIKIDEARKIIMHKKRSDVSSVIEKVTQMAVHTVSGKPTEKMRRSLVSDFECETLLNKFQLIRDKKLEIITDHIQKITGKEPMLVQEYLQVHEDYYKPEDISKSKSKPAPSASVSA